MVRWQPTPFSQDPRHHLALSASPKDSFRTPPTFRSGQLTYFAFELLAVTKQDVEEHFNTHGSGKITDIKLMNGFGFIEYEDAMDARDVVPGKTVDAVICWGTC